ncbi:HupE/UreJ family protein [Thalassotalea fonticola]|uniref:HupE/UreJ family protein n=1 Tax=Thalassotalea fonticola TaxID=3065649 RepID=A0ABZ0GRT7_9GAMM|nr:HupE/UreJ family protein [Colwelliaceae bacterium S1-1]
MKYVLLYLLMFFSTELLADDMRPASVNINLVNDTDFDLVWKIPIRNGVRETLTVVFPEDTKLLAPKRTHIINNAYIEYTSFQRKSGVVGLKLRIDGIERSSGDVLLRVSDTQQQTITTVLNIEQPSFIVNSLVATTAFNTALTYIELGIEHILIGLDHLLFVACLVYISGTGKKLLLTITGFTIAHSITLFLSATGVFVIPIQPVEAVIALSIIFLAWEIAKNRKHSLSLRYPVLVSSSFGLLHGFGFAAVLSEIGLPAAEKTLALLSFNIGVEVGQLMFVFALFIVFKFIAIMYKSLSLEKLRIPVSYACGSIATIWMIERLAVF